MSRSTPWLIAAALTLLPLSQARALCVYHGDLYAETTLAQEFGDSGWVVRGRVVSAEDNWSDGRMGDDEAPWTLYRVQILERFKGEPTVEVSVFTYRDSGGFYMDRGGDGADIGGEYLLFLNPTEPGPDLPIAARDAMIVNYSCGQSRSWLEVPQADRLRLAALAGQAVR